MLANPRKNISRPALNLSFIVVVSAVFSMILIRLYLVQIKQGPEFTRRSLGNFVQTKRIKHSRGEIVDRKGRVLVANRASFDVAVTPAFLPNTRRNILRLAQTVESPKTEAAATAVAFWRTLEDHGPPVLLGRDLTEEQSKRLRDYQEGLDIPLEAIPIIPAQPTKTGDPRFSAYLDPDHFPSVTLVFRRVARIVGLEESEYRRLLEASMNRSGLGRYRDLAIRNDVSAGVAARLNLQIELGDLPGISVRESQSRDYRNGGVAAHLLGYVNELSAEEFESKKAIGYRLGDVVGRRGIEKTFETQLRGEDGLETTVVDSKGRAQHSRLASLLRDEVGMQEPSRPGGKVVLTIDLELQRVAEEAFRGRAGAIVAMETKTGRILVLTSTPSFDPNLVSGAFDRTERERIRKLRAYRPWRFRAIQDHYAPGSTFKPFTVLAALKKRATYASEEILCGGIYQMGDTQFRCWKHGGHGPIAMVASLAQSCDVYYYNLGARIGLDPIAKLARSFGFGSKTGVDLPGEVPGIMPTKAWYNKRFREGYTGGAAVNVSIGQGAVTVTPLQLAVAYSALVNGGHLYRPQIALRVEDVDGGEERKFEPELVRKIRVPRSYLQYVRRGLHRAVNSMAGTAFKKRIREPIVAGKTGTAQVAKLGLKRLRTNAMKWKVRDHAWFAAYAPSKKPEIVVVVLNEHGGHGGSAAAPAAMKVIKAWWNQKQIRANSDQLKTLTIIGESG